MSSIQQLLQAANQRLPMFEAEVLLAHVLQKSRTYLYAYREQMVRLTDEQRFVDYIERRCHQEPIAYITGVREFWSLALMVNQETLIPRPETELLVEKILSLWQADVAITVADLGTGSGAIALALQWERPTWRVYATDLSQGALLMAKQNADRLGLHQVHFCQGDWCRALPSNERMDVMVSNPPYIAETEWADYADGLAFEPRLALTAGVSGLDAITTISREATRCLKSSGLLWLEHGWMQAPAVRDILAGDGYRDIVSFCDLAGHERITVGRNK